MAGYTIHGGPTPKPCLEERRVPHGHAGGGPVSSGVRVPLVNTTQWYFSNTCRMARLASMQASCVVGGMGHHNELCGYLMVHSETAHGFGASEHKKISVHTAGHTPEAQGHGSEGCAHHMAQRPPAEGDVETKGGGGGQKHCAWSMLVN